jgi:hypothetical protein
MYLELTIKDRKVTTCNRLDLKTLGSRPNMPKTYSPRTLIAAKQTSILKAPELGNQSLSATEPHK